jgi:hypothetical protein
MLTGAIPKSARIAMSPDAPACSTEESSSAVAWIIAGRYGYWS